MGYNGTTFMAQCNAVQWMADPLQQLLFFPNASNCKSIVKFYQTRPYNQKLSYSLNSAEDFSAR